VTRVGHPRTNIRALGPSLEPEAKPGGDLLVSARLLVEAPLDRDRLFAERVSPTLTVMRARDLVAASDEFGSKLESRGVRFCFAAPRPFREPLPTSVPDQIAHARHSQSLASPVAFWENDTVG
jgi:hypothetical protein